MKGGDVRRTTRGTRVLVYSPRPSVLVEGRGRRKGRSVGVSDGNGTSCGTGRKSLAGPQSNTLHFRTTPPVTSSVDPLRGESLGPHGESERVLVDTEETRCRLFNIYEENEKRNG